MGRAWAILSVVLLPMLIAPSAAQSLSNLDPLDVLPEGGPGSSATCTVTATLIEDSGFAPLDAAGSASVDGSGFNCYQLWLVPEFPFHGSIRVELQDVHGRTAFLRFEVVMLTVTEPLITQATPGLQLGPNMTFRVTIAGAGPMPVTGIGAWSAGVDVGTM